MVINEEPAAKKGKGKAKAKRARASTPPVVEEAAVVTNEEPAAKKGKGKAKAKPKPKPPGRTPASARRAPAEAASDVKTPRASAAPAGGGKRARAASVDAETDADTPSSKRGRVKQEKEVVRILVSGEVQIGQSEKIQGMGAVMVDKIEDCTHLFTDKASRKTKFLAAIGLGKFIVGSQWAKESIQQNHFVDGDTYTLVDKKAEKTWSFNLRQTLAKSKGTRVFEGQAFMVDFGAGSDAKTKGRIKAMTQDFKTMITANGGVFANKDGSGVHTVVDKSNPPKKAHAGTVVDKEFVLMAVLQQKPDARKFAVKGAYAQSTPAVRAKVAPAHLARPPPPLPPPLLSLSLRATLRATRLGAGRHDQT